MWRTQTHSLRFATNINYRSALPSTCKLRTANTPTLVFWNKNESQFPAILCQRSPSLMQGCCRQPAACRKKIIKTNSSRVSLNRSGRWWLNRGSAWPTRNTARTSRREETWPRRWWAVNWQRDASMTLAQIGDVHPGVKPAAWRDGGG